MIYLARTLRAWNTPDFEDVLKDEIGHLDPDSLPLQQGLSQGSYARHEDFSIMLIRAAEEQDFIAVKTGIHFTGVIAGCNCADDPTPVDGIAEYCELQFTIDRKTAATTVALLPDNT